MTQGFLGRSVRTQTAEVSCVCVPPVVWCHIWRLGEEVGSATYSDQHGPV